MWQGDRGLPPDPRHSLSQSRKEKNFPLPYHTPWYGGNFCGRQVVENPVAAGGGRFPEALPNFYSHLSPQNTFFFSAFGILSPYPPFPGGEKNTILSPQPRQRRETQHGGLSGVGGVVWWLVVGWVVGWWFEGHGELMRGKMCEKTISV